MNPNFKQMTLQELHDGLFAGEAYKNFIPKYCSLLLERIPDQSEETRSMPSVANHDPELIQAAATEVAQLIPQAFRIFKLIVELPGEKKPGSDFTEMQKALHEYMLKTLYHINRNCRTLLEAQIDYDKVDTLTDYLRYLKKKYDLLDKQLMLVGQEWHENDELIYYSLVERENKLKVFDTETNGICFQIYNKNLDNQLKVPKENCTSNGLIISKRYFFFAIFRLFQHLQLNTQIYELEKTGIATVETIEEAEVGTYLMDAFHLAAKEIL
jgi:hypothetical protein